MILRKYLSLLGIGSAKINLILPNGPYRPGDSVHGYFLINGGTIEQQIKQIDCDLVLINKSEGSENVIISTTILMSAWIDSQETNKVAFTFHLPDPVPSSSKEISYLFKTKLTFNKGIESFDQDNIKIIE
ncbi:MAG: sporulation protein [Bacillus sp. (in: Bacteria)]|nr:sporulation protein [Bacillus sp. (in: firmicutes)]